jgi:hypothetical protein
MEEWQKRPSGLINGFEILSTEKDWPRLEREPTEFFPFRILDPQLRDFETKGFSFTSCAYLNPQLRVTCPKVLSFASSRLTWSAPPGLEPEGLR